MTDEETRELHEETEAFWQAVPVGSESDPRRLRDGVQLGRRLQIAMREYIGSGSPELDAALRTAIASVDEAVAIYDELADEAEARH